MKDDDISQPSDISESHPHLQTDLQQTCQCNNDSSESVSQQHQVEHTDHHTIDQGQKKRKKHITNTLSRLRSHSVTLTL